jgi:phosphoribosyl-AMP cyclohydrolase
MSSQSQQPVRKRLAIDFATNPLVPAVIVDAVSGDVLMVGFMNEEAYVRTRETGRTHFWSRTRNKLWKKGETSGHEQVVERMSINCELNSLLITVHQTGAVCHNGYPSCFYRDIDDEESLIINMDRWFDPAVVYGDRQDPAMLWYGSYRFLKASPLEDVSPTSKLLRSDASGIPMRVADELEELAGALDGSHRHGSLEDDLLLEGSQSLYWLALAATSSDILWEELRPDRAMDTTTTELSSQTAARLLRSEATAWRQMDMTPGAERIHVAMSLVAQAVLSGGVDPAGLIERDLGELREKPYLAEYFAV